MSHALLIKLYALLPNTMKRVLGQSSLLKPLRRRLLYTKTSFKTAKVFIERSYSNYDLGFHFVASIKIASKAQREGIENTLLHNTFKLVQRYKPNRTDLTVLDVGSNFGYLASVWSHSIANNGMTIAFEPNKNVFTCIEKTIEANNANHKFNVYNLAIGSKNEMITLNASNFSSNIHNMPSTIETYQIEMVKLDDFIKRNAIEAVDLIKIDVDGIELDILEGAKKTIKQSSAIVIVETNDDKRIIDFFKDEDYAILDMKLQRFHDSDTLPLNIFCVPKTLKGNAI